MAPLQKAPTQTTGLVSEHVPDYAVIYSLHLDQLLKIKKDNKFLFET